MKSDLRRAFKFREQELRRIINSWNLIAGCLADEFDALNHILIGHLERESGKDKLCDVIHSELITRYGLDVKHDEALVFATKVLEWWSNRN